MTRPKCFFSFSYKKNPTNWFCQNTYNHDYLTVWTMSCFDHLSNFDPGEIRTSYWMNSTPQIMARMGRSIGSLREAVTLHDSCLHAHIPNSTQLRLKEHRWFGRRVQPFICPSGNNWINENRPKFSHTATHRNWLFSLIWNYYMIRKVATLNHGRVRL